MSIQVNLRALPSQFSEGVYAKSDQQRMIRSSDSVLTPLSFPKSKVALWDPTPNGDVVSLHLSYYRNPKLQVLEKALRLAHRHARQSNKPQFSCFLIGLLAVDDDEEGVTLTLDRFDPGREQPGSSTKMPTALLPGDFLVPLTIDTQGVASNGVMVHSTENFNIAFKMLHHSCSSREAMELSSLITLRAHLGCLERLDCLSVTLHWGALTISNTLDAVPVKPVTIIPTALARNLSSPSSMTQPLHSTSRKQGFLTMDQTRKLLLILESDPKAYTLPLVGVWLSGITHIHNPQVWAWCLRYLYSSSLQEKVMSEDGTFLVVLYSLTHRDPEFYQCQLCSGQPEIGFQLLTSTETLTLYKNVEVSEARLLQFELSPENPNQETEFFKEVASAYHRTAGASAAASPQNQLSVSDHDSGVEDEDLSPRPSPNPHPPSQQTKRIYPSVPELSLVLDGSFLDRGTVASHRTTPSHGQGSATALQQSGPSYQSHPGSRSSGQVAGLNGPPPIRPPLTRAIQPGKASKGRGSPRQQQQQQLQSCTGRKPVPSTGRQLSERCQASPANSTSSSSSSSSPKTGLSPNTSAHQHRQPPVPMAPHRESQQSPVSNHSILSSPALPLPPGQHSLRRSASFPSQTPTHPHPLKNFQNTHSPNTSPHSLGSPCSCCSHQHGHTPAHHAGHWHGMPNTPTLPHVASVNPGGVCFPPSENIPCHDCCGSPSRRPFGCQSCPHQSPVRRSSPHGPCSPVRDPSAVEQAAHICQVQCCQGQPTCPTLPSEPSIKPVDGPVGLLPADAYRILMDQDRQLKLLQAQIQKLLEAQHKAAAPFPPSSQLSPVCTEQPSSQLEYVTTHVQTRKCVSIAVSTGASLFWSSPPEGPTHEELLSEPGRQSDTHAESWPAQEDACPSLLSSGLPSFHTKVDWKEEEGNGLNPNTPRGSRQSQVFQSPILGESASMYCQPQSPPRGGQQIQDGRTLEDEQRFYQELMCQVNSRLRGSVNEAEDARREGPTRTTHPGEGRGLCPKGSQPHWSSFASTQLDSQRRDSSPKQPDQDQVLQATLRQLQQLGVTMELDSSPQGKVTRNTVESASMLACINPEAVIPRLALSESVGTSIWGPSGSVDLSLEANAIALKYLSDSQLSRFSLGSRPSEPPKNPNAMRLGKNLVENSPLGLSVLSPGNMSFATKKYMKRYGLMEGEDSGGEEEVAMDKDVLHLESALGHSAQLDNLGTFGVEQGEKRDQGLILKNITNKQPHSVPLHRPTSLDSQSQLLKDLRPKMQLLACTSKRSTQKENEAQATTSAGVATQRSQGSSGTEESVGNFLDLSRLRQLPKLF